MARSNALAPYMVSLMLGRNLGLENVAIHPDSDGTWRHPALSGFRV
jgi:hypothetical protein